MPSGEEAALVVLSAEVNGKSVRVHVQLLGEAHNWAIMAYQRELPLTVTGNLVYERRTWRLTGEIEVDSQYLRRLADSDSPDVGPGRGEALS
jgi:hypothetical protein